MFKRYEFSPAQWRQIKGRCDRDGILFLSTPQNPSDLNLLLEIGVPAVKVGSDDFTNIPLLRLYAATKLPLIASCGMADLEEVRASLTAIGTLAGYPTILLLCTSEYPTPPADVNLLKLRTLSEHFPTAVLGFSDHTQGPLAASLAVAMGARVLEKHFTLDHGLPGPDHWYSEDPQGLSAWIGSARAAYKMLGSPVVRPTTKELEMRTLARRSIVALKDIAAGEILDERNLGLRRPGDGLPPGAWDLLVGKRAARRLAKGAQIQIGDVS
jgi:sialic acid synthase SpsE